jgi:hypothetical protein
MIIRDVPSWDAFQEEIRRLVTEYQGRNSPLLFRGLPNSEYDLTTTLERSGGENMSFDEYYRTIHRIKGAVGTLTGGELESRALQ